MTTGECCASFLVDLRLEHGAIDGGWPAEGWSSIMAQQTQQGKWSHVDPTRGEKSSDVLSSLHPNEVVEINTIEVLQSPLENREVHLAPALSHSP